MPVHRTHLPVSAPFDLRLCLFGHGWVALTPHSFDEDEQQLDTVLRVGSSIVDATLRQADTDNLRLELHATSKLRRAQVEQAKQQVAHMLRLDDDLGEFYAICKRSDDLAWVAQRNAGRLMRSATVFEDLMKLLFTTNTTWTSTEAMTRNLVAAAGSRSPGGARAFPTPKQCVRDEAFYRDVVRCGYRAGAAIELATAFANGELRDETFLSPQPSVELWQRLCDLRGFGPYAAGQAMRLCGHYDRLAIDSWCRAQLAARSGRKQPPSDKAIERRYKKFAPFQGLALWCDLTADWHGEG